MKGPMLLAEAGSPAGTQDHISFHLLKDNTPQFFLLSPVSSVSLSLLELSRQHKNTLLFHVS